jgi:hypothetical protein
MSEPDLDLYNAFPREVIVRGQSLYFRIGDAPRVVQFLRGQGIDVLGIEGFHGDQRGIRPDLDRIADLTGAADSAQSAWWVLSQWAADPSLLVEFTVDRRRVRRR